MQAISKSHLESTSIEAVVIRKDGTREELGTIAYWHRNPLRRWAHALRMFARGKRAGSIRH